MATDVQTRERRFVKRITYVVLSVLDLVLTISLLSRYGGEVEQNPVARYVYENFSYLGLCTLKFLSVGFVLWAIDYLERNKLFYARVLWAAAYLSAAAAVMMGVICHAV